MNAKKARLETSYDFFCAKLKNNEAFSVEQIMQATGWKISTVRTYIAKNWDDFLIKESSFFRVDTEKFSYEKPEYIRMMSQKLKHSSNPFRPELSETVESLVEKARDCAVLAVDIYNRPMTSFRTYGFSVMMIIAWTSLMHAIFESEGVDYFHKKQDGTYQTIDGDKKAWELSTCIDKYSALNNTIKANLEFFINLRNKIEHRMVPAIDLTVYGECQALLLNFEELLTSKFTGYYSLNSSLTIPVQILTSRQPWQYETMKKLQARHYDELKDYIDVYRQNLSDEIGNDNKYSFKAFLVPKIGNHRTSSDIALEFINADSLNPEELAGLEKGIALIKEKTIPVANQGTLKPQQVCDLVEAKIGKKFHTVFHARAWNYYKIRKKGYQAHGCNTEYCQYDEPHKDYVYTQNWVDFLVSKLVDDDEYEKVKNYRG